MMTTAITHLTRPVAGSDTEQETPHRRIGIGAGIVGLALAMGVLVIGIAVADAIGSADPIRAGELAAIGFGIQTLAFATLKVGIAIVLIGILIRLWIRVESVKTAIEVLKPASDGSTIKVGDISTGYGPATVGITQAETLPIHKMARTMWAPMLAMGYMAVLAGLATSIVWSAEVADGSTTAAAWTQGLQFMGEGMVLAGISFLLGSILGGLRDGGGDVQASLGVQVLTLKMPKSAKAFIGLMMFGLMVSVAQFVLYIVTTGFSDPETVRLWFSVLGPMRELGLGIILSAIALALATIGQVLGFQFWRLRSIIETEK